MRWDPDEEGGVLDPVFGVDGMDPLLPVEFWLSSDDLFCDVFMPLEPATTFSSLIDSRMSGAWPVAASISISVSRRPAHVRTRLTGISHLRIFGIRDWPCSLERRDFPIIVNFERMLIWRSEIKLV